MKKIITLMSGGQKDNQIENLINSALRSGDQEFYVFRPKFELKLKDLNLTFHQAEKSLDIEYKTLNRLLDGDIKKFDLISLLKLSYFLDLPEREITERFFEILIHQSHEELLKVKKMMFILNTFDTETLKKIGVISSTKNFEEIEQKLCSMFGLSSILDYNRYDVGAAHSTTKIKPRHEKNRNYFKSKAKEIFKHIANPYSFDKQGLINYFPKIRWHSTNVPSGLVDVIKSLYKLGVTVVFQPKVPLLQMRGATFEVNDKPCIVLTDYRDSYPTLWFAFLHELFHVLFDWDEILEKRYHISDEDNDLDLLKHKENEANEFAREYLFPEKKFDLISNYIKQPAYVKEFAVDHHVHPSIIYSNFANRFSTQENNLWMRFHKLIRPNMDPLLQTLNSDLSHSASAKSYAIHYKTNIYKD